MRDFRFSHCHAAIIEFSWTAMRRNTIVVWTRDNRELIAIGISASLQPWKTRVVAEVVLFCLGLYTFCCLHSSERTPSLSTWPYRAGVGRYKLYQGFRKFGPPCAIFEDTTSPSN